MTTRTKALILVGFQLSVRVLDGQAARGGGGRSPRLENLFVKSKE